MRPQNIASRIAVRPVVAFQQSETGAMARQGVSSGADETAREARALPAANSVRYELRLIRKNDGTLEWRD